MTEGGMTRVIGSSGPVPLGPPPHAEATNTVISPPDPTATASTERPFVIGELLLPAGRRQLAAVLLRSCPYCHGGPHLHRVRGAGPWHRSAGCGLGHYWITASDLAVVG